MVTRAEPVEWVARLFPEVRPRRSQDVSSDTLNRILDGVEQNLLTRDPARITVTSILAACGVSRTNFYRYFQDSEDAIRGYSLREVREGLIEIWSRYAGEPPSREQVARVSTDMVLAFRVHPVTAVLRERNPALLAGMLSMPPREVLEHGLRLAGRGFYLDGTRGRIVLEALSRLIMTLCLTEAVTVPDTRRGMERFFLEMLPEE